MREPIEFNKPYVTGKELSYINEAILAGKVAGNGAFTKRCQAFFEDKYGFKKAMLTTSATDALEMSGILLDIRPGDEIIMPAYTFVSTANAFALRGAKIVFADSYPDNPNINPEQVEALITTKTKAIVPVHYAGVACDMDYIMELAGMHGVRVVEDAAQAIDSFYKGRALGSIGHMGAFSFHETKNIIAGEGGMITVNTGRLIDRAEVVWEKGTNRNQFLRGEVSKYEWIGLGSSFLPSEMIAAFLFAQLQDLDNIQRKRKQIWSIYFDGLKDLAERLIIELPVVPDYATNNASLFYIICKNINERTRLATFLKEEGINTAFHYSALHKSPYFRGSAALKELPNADKFSDCLLRLPLYYNLEESDQQYVVDAIQNFFKFQSG